MNGTPPNALDKRRVAATFAAAAERYEQHDAVQREVANRVLEQLDYIKLAPARVLDLGSGTGRCARALATRYRHAAVHQCDIAPPMLALARSRERRWLSRQHFTCADLEALPFREGAFELVFSNLALQWASDLGRAFAECRRVLAPGGVILFTTLGPDTLRELRAAWASVSNAPRVNRFPDMHEVGDALIAHGFADPVMSTEYITVEYADALAVMRDLKGLGAANADRARTRGLTGRRTLAAVGAAYEACRRDGTLPATYEVVFGHAFAAARSAHVAGGVQTFPLARLRRR